MTPLAYVVLVLALLLAAALFVIVHLLDRLAEARAQEDEIIERATSLVMDTPWRRDGLRETIWNHPMRALLPFMLLPLLVGCPGAASVVPTLGAIVGRVDVPRLLECAAMRGSERARCLGASVLTTALDVAVDKAAALADRARDVLDGGAGAEVDENAKQQLAVDLDKALADVGREVAAAQG